MPNRMVAPTSSALLSALPSNVPDVRRVVVLAVILIGCSGFDLEGTTPQDFLNDETKMCPSGVVAYSFADCPIETPSDWEIELSNADQARIDELQDAPDGMSVDEGQQRAFEITTILSSYLRPGDDLRLCGSLQGRRVDGERELSRYSDYQVRIDELLETTCPGNLDLLVD